MSTLPTDLSNCSFSLFAEACVELRREGIPLEISTAVQMAPHLKDDIEAFLPAMLMLDDAVMPASVVPKTVAGCTIEEEIGRGAMGVVFKGFQPEFDRCVAIKVLRKTPILDDSFKRFEVERAALGRLEHPNIVRAYSYSQDPQNAYLIMQYVDGISLEDLCSSESYQAAATRSHLRSDWHSLAILARDIASALSHAHSRGMVHRDIKPSNLLLDKNSKIWVADFGLAKLLDQRFEISQTGAAVGTPRYMAPEQLQGVCDARADIYSLGVSLVRLVTGEMITPFDDREQLAASLEACSMPKGLIQVLEKACRPEPEARYQDANELETVLNRFIKGNVPDRRSEMRTGATTIWDKLSRRVVLYPIVIFVFLLAATLSACLLIYMFTPNRGPDSESESKVTSSIANIASEVIGEIGSELDLSQDDQATIREGVRGLLSRATTGDLKSSDLKEAAEAMSVKLDYIPLRFARVSNSVMHSPISQADKELAIRTVSRYAYCFKNRLISDEEAVRNLEQLEILLEKQLGKELLNCIRQLEVDMSRHLPNSFTPEFEGDIRYSFPQF